jgi:pimeloyl-ACP methyl ester carboxylesterase
MSDVSFLFMHLNDYKLVVTGTEDVAAPAANSLIIVQKIPGAWLVQIKGGGHGVMFQYPEEFTRILQTFIAAATPSGTMPKQ